MNDCPRRLNSVKLEQVADGFIIHLPEKEQVHYLNTTAAIILELCEGELSASQIAAALQELYDLAEPPLAEVEECLGMLRKQDLVM